MRNLNRKIDYNNVIKAKTPDIKHNGNKCQALTLFIVSLYYLVTVLAFNDWLGKATDTPAIVTNRVLFFIFWNI